MPGGEGVDFKQHLLWNLTRLLGGGCRHPLHNRFSLFAALVRLLLANALASAAVTDATGWPRSAQIRTSRQHAPLPLQMPLILSSVPPSLPPVTVAAVGVCGCQLLTAAEEVCLECCAALFRDFLFGQGPAGMHKALASVQNEG